MSPHDNNSDRPLRHQFHAMVRVVVEGNDEVTELYAENISAGGLFVRSDTPEPVGSHVVIELALPGGLPLCTIAGIVRHARPATTPGEANAGMGIEITQLDERARKLASYFDKRRESQNRPRRAPQIPSVPHTPPPIRTKGPVLGIDLGTSNSCIARVIDGRPVVLSSSRGYQSVPSVLFVERQAVAELDFDDLFDQAEDLAAGDDAATPPAVAPARLKIPDLEGLSYRIGHQAIEQMILSPGRAIYGSKRFLGRPFSSNEVQTLGHFFTYPLVEGPQGQAAAKIGEHVISLESVATCILATLREMAEQHLGQGLCRAVITVPADFGETQRAAVREAAHRAGLRVERLINEPTAAALTYAYQRGLQQRILVFDLGGGTFDTSVLRIDGDDIQVLSTAGDPFLGGSDFDDRLTEYVLMQLEKGRLPNIRHDPVAVQRLRFSVELAKQQLSQLSQVTLSVPHIGKDAQGAAVHVEETIERELFERLTDDLIDRCLAVVDQALSRAQIKGSQLDAVVVVGGQSRSPHVRTRLEQRFGKKPSTRVHPDEGVAQGAAILAYRIETGQMPKLQDILSATVCLAGPDDQAIVLFERGAALPAETQVDVAALLRKQSMLSLFRGERSRASQNTLIGLMPFPKLWVDEGQALRLDFKLSADGLISAGARDPGSGQYREVQVQVSRTLT